MRVLGRLSLKLRLVLAGAIAIGVALSLAAAGLSALFATHVERRAVAELSVQLDQVLAGLDTGSDGLILATAPADPRFEKPFAGLYWQIETPGRVIRSRSLWDKRLDLPSDRFTDGEIHLHRLASPLDGELLVLERSVVLPARLGGLDARAAVAMETAELEEARQAFVADILPYLGLLGAALILAGWVQVTVGLNPLRSLRERVAALGDGKAERMGDDWPSDVRPLAARIDALLDARAEDANRARMRAGDLAHGLKTPLQALIGEASRLRQAGEIVSAAGIEEIAAAMRRTVDGELARARTAARMANAKSKVAPVVSSIVSVLQRTPEGGRVAWSIDVPDSLAVALDEADLAEALGALAENAARHAHGRIAISAHADDGTLALTVSDDGPGIAASQRARMTRRFARADERHTGHGLGLAIAGEITEAAGGRLELADAGPGLSATLFLPLG